MAEDREGIPFPWYLCTQRGTPTEWDAPEDFVDPTQDLAAGGDETEAHRLRVTKSSFALIRKVGGVRGGRRGGVVEDYHRRGR